MMYYRSALCFGRNGFYYWVISLLVDVTVAQKVIDPITELTAALKKLGMNDLRMFLILIEEMKLGNWRKVFKR